MEKGRTGDEDDGVATLALFRLGIGHAAKTEHLRTNLGALLRLALVYDNVDVGSEAASTPSSVRQATRREGR